MLSNIVSWPNFNNYLQNTTQEEFHLNQSTIWFIPEFFSNKTIF